MKNIVIFLTLSLSCINVSAQQFIVENEIFKVQESDGVNSNGDKDVEVIYGKDTIRIVYFCFPLENSPFVVQKIYFGQNHSELFISGIGKRLFLIQKDENCQIYDLFDYEMIFLYIKEEDEWIRKK